MTFKHHAANLKSKMQDRNNILKVLSGTSWGKEKEVILTTYKAISQSLVNYASPIWTPSLAPSNMKPLQNCQNVALRTALGCVKMSPVEHLHRESKFPKLGDHCAMLSKQFMLATQKDDHPNNLDISGVKPRKYRHMKDTLTSKYGPQVRDYIPDGELNEDTYRRTLKKIHTDSVSKTIEDLGPNNLLQIKPPEIHPSEKTLPRKTRTTLAQLRCGYSTYLHSYMARIDNNFSNICPKCNLFPHYTEHLFNCPADQTNLDIESLWKKPVEAAAFLGLDTGEERQGVG